MKNKEKNAYEKAELELIIFTCEDIVTASGQKWDSSNVDSNGWT